MKARFTDLAVYTALKAQAISLFNRLKMFQSVQSYPLYHTLYETHHLAGNMIDRGFVHHRAITQLWAEVARNLTESDILPFDVQWYASYLNNALADLQTRYTAQLNQSGIYFGTNGPVHFQSLPSDPLN